MPSPRRHTACKTTALLLFATSRFSAPAFAQTPASASSPTEPTQTQAQAAPIVVPAGTRLPLVLRNGINTRTSKAGDSVYFETVYPLALNNRIVIPIGTFLRGQLLASRRPGFVKGRGEIRMTLDQMTMPNGYTLSLSATPSSVDRDGREGVDKEGTVQGRSDTKSDVGLVLVTTGSGAFIGTLAGAAVNGAAGTGALIGAGAGILAILATRGPEAELPRGTTLDVIFNHPLVLDAALLPANEPGHLSTPLPPVPEKPRDDRHRRLPPRVPSRCLAVVFATAAPQAQQSSACDLPFFASNCSGILIIASLTAFHNRCAKGGISLSRSHQRGETRMSEVGQTAAKQQTIAQTQTYPAKAFAATSATAGLSPYGFKRRQPGPQDVRIEILYCGVCHSDLHQARDEWHEVMATVYPCVPGHEIVGRVTKVGSSVKKFKAGDTVGVGCMVNSCRTCPNCLAGEQQYCVNFPTLTYNAEDKILGGVTYGGYSDSIVVDEAFVLRVPEKLNLAGVAPLLCAGITTYSPLHHWKVGRGQKVGVVGLGGLGHMGVKFAKAFGAHVVLFTTSPGKTADARRLGADEVVISKNAEEMAKHASTFNFILDTVSGDHDLNSYLSLLKLDGSLVLVGAPEKPAPIAAFNLIMPRRRLAGSAIGGIRETQEMLDFCAEKEITADIEMIPIQKINDAYERLLKSDVKYRFVIDMASLKQSA
jgi:alcohol dehydrogenase (NADP+)